MRSSAYRMKLLICRAFLSIVLLFLFLNHVRTTDLIDSTVLQTEFDLESATDERTLVRTPINPISCDRIDSDFFHYLLKRYNKDDQPTGRMKTLCNNLEYAATCCQANKHLFNLIQNPPIDRMTEDDHNFSQSIIRLCPLILFKTNQQTCIAKQDSTNYPTKPNPTHVWAFAFLFVIMLFLLKIAFSYIKFVSNLSVIYE